MTFELSGFFRKSYKTLIFFSVLVAAFLSFASCAKDGDDETQTIEPLPLASGDLYGYVGLYDDKGLRIEQAGMLVTIEGSSPTISGISNDEGQFIIRQAPYGFHTLVFSKAGFGIHKLFMVENIDDGDPTRVENIPRLSQLATTEVRNVELLLQAQDASFFITFNGRNGEEKLFRYFVSSDPTVSSENQMIGSSTISTTYNPSGFNMPYLGLINSGFTSGERVYVRFYGESFYPSGYIDNITNEIIFSSLNPVSAAAVSFIVP